MRKRRDKRKADAIDGAVDQPSPDWEAYKGRKSLSLYETVALSLNVVLDFREFPLGAPRQETEESLVAAYHRRVSIVQGHIEDGTLRVRKRIFEGMEMFGLSHIVEIDVASFRELANTKGWELPREFPGGQAAPPISPTLPPGTKPGPVSASTGKTINLPHLTKTLDGLFQVMRDVWTAYDPANPPKQNGIAAAIDKKLGWSTKSDGTPSRSAETLAAAIRPDALADADVRRKIRPRRGPS